MTIFVLIFIIFALLAVLVLRDPELRRKLGAVLLRRRSVVKVALGIHQPRDLQRQVMALVKEKALLSAYSAHLPTDVTVFLNPDDLDGLGATRDDFCRELVEQIADLKGADAGGELKFTLGARPQVELKPDPRLATGTVELKVAWLEGTIAVTALPGDESPVGPVSGLRLLVEVDGEAPREVTLIGRMTVGRDPGSDVRIDHASVSRKHAVLTVEGPEAVTIVDWDSQNGVEPEGEGKITPHTDVPMRAGQPVRLSKHVRIELISDETQVDLEAELRGLDA